MDETEIKPLFGNVLIEPLKTNISGGSGSIYIPAGRSDENTAQGIVIKVGEGIHGRPNINIGDTVIYAKDSAINLIEVDSKKILVLDSLDILGVII